ncbi:MAG: heavy metal-associated domain-containing protein [Ilumatobacteraceae bacterium]
MCGARIERKLNKLDGVTASVNYATERDITLADRPVDVADLIATIEATGYGAHEPDPDVAEPDRAAELWRRLVVAVVLGLPVLLLSMILALQFDGWQWVALVLADAGRHVVGLAVPPRDGAQPPPPQRHDGHAGRSVSSRPTCGRCGRCCSPPPATSAWR